MIKAAVAVLLLSVCFFGASSQNPQVLADKAVELGVDYIAGEALIEIKDSTVCKNLSTMLNSDFRILAQEFAVTRNMFPLGTYLERIYQKPIRLPLAEVGACFYRVIFGGGIGIITRQSLWLENSIFDNARQRLEPQGIIIGRDFIGTKNDFTYSISRRTDRQYYLAEMKMPKLWVEGVVGGVGVPLVLMDSGVEEGHPELKHCVNVAETRVFYGLNTVDHIGHGTFGAGLICGKGLEISGVAPEGKVFSFKVIDRVYILGQPVDQGTVSSLINAYIEVLNNHDILSPSGAPIVVANALAFINDVPQVLSVIRAGREIFLTVAASGNYFSTTASYPAIYAASTDNVLCVSSVDKNGNLSLFANLCPEKNSIATYGEEMTSAFHGGGYAIGAGTSFATHLMAGLIAGIGADAVKRHRKVTPQSLLRDIVRSAEIDSRLVRFYMLRIQRDALRAWREVLEGVPPPRQR